MALLQVSCLFSAKRVREIDLAGNGIMVRVFFLDPFELVWNQGIPKHDMIDAKGGKVTGIGVTKTSA